MRPRAHESLEHEPIGGEHGKCQPRGECLRRRCHGRHDLHNLRPKKTGLLAEERCYVLEPTRHSLRFRGSLIFAGTQVRIRAQPVSCTIDFEIIRKAFSEPLGARRQRARKSRKAGDPQLPLVKRQSPCLVGGKKAAQIPCVIDRHIPTRGNYFYRTNGHFHTENSCLHSSLDSTSTAATRRCPTPTRRQNRTRRPCCPDQSAQHAMPHPSPVESNRWMCCRSGRG